MSAYHAAWAIVNKKTQSVAIREETGQIMVFSTPENAYKTLFSINKPRQDDFEVRQNRVTLPWRDW